MINDDIISLIKQGVFDQQDLTNKLQSLGYKLTQSSVSRKLKQLGITKLHGEYKIMNSNIKNNTKATFVPPNLIVISTLPGHANVLATKIDEALISNTNHPEFIGSIAGDDTIFLSVNLNDQPSSIAMNKVNQILTLKL